jgi:hypothetical protein
MEGLIKFFIRAEVGIYLVAGLVLFIALMRLIKLSNEKKKTVFGLEQEIIAKKIHSTFTMVALSALMILAELFFVSYASVKYPNISIKNTPTVEVQATPTISINAIQNGPTPEVSSTGAQSNSEGCVKGQIEWLSPKAGDEVKGSIELKGTVNVSNLGFYKFEYHAVGEANWTTIAGANQAVIEGPLGGTWNSQNVTPGDYQLRIVAYDSQNNEFPSCTISIRVVAP